MKKLIVIEGIDGSGKSTQIELLKDFLARRKIAFRYVHFPRSGVGRYGDLVARFLRGEFGRVESIDPYLVALLYAGDRNDAKETIKNWLAQDFVVLADRYVYSNVAFQCAKTEDPGRKIELEKWILDFEYAYNRIPRPALSIYLHVPFSFAEKQLAKPRTGDDRAYLKGKRDIHESSSALQANVAKEYARLTEKYDDLRAVSCVGEDGETVLPREEIHSAIISMVKKVVF